MFDGETSEFIGKAPSESAEIPVTGSADFIGKYRAFETRYFTVNEMGEGDASMAVDFAADTVALAFESGPVVSNASGVINREYRWIENQAGEDLTFFARFLGATAGDVAGTFDYDGFSEHWVSGQFILKR